MHLLAKTLQPPQHGIGCVSGHFTGLTPPEFEEFVINLGTYLSIYRHSRKKSQKAEEGESEEDEIKRLAIEPMFCHIFAISKLTMSESPLDFLVVTSDSGNICVFSLEKAKFTAIVSLPFARTGIQINEPGYFLSVSPCGRAIFTASIEKSKVAWPVSLGDRHLPEVSSPIESNRSHTIIFSVAPLDVGYEAPTFAFLERRFKPPKGEPEPLFDASNTQKLLTYYEIDANIHTIVRKSEISVAASANLLVSVPGPLYSGPGGVIVCANGSMQYFPGKGDSSILLLPSRKDTSSVITSSAVFSSNSFFILLQNQFGDLLIVDIPSGNNIRVRYFDTVPLASSLSILAQGVLVVIAESGPIEFYAINSIDGIDTFEISPSAELQHITQFGSIQTMSRLTKLVSIPSYSPLGDFVSIHGSSSSSSLKLTSLGIPIRIIFRTEIGGQPSKIRAIKEKPTDPFHSHLLISSGDQTRILEVGGGSIKETTESKFFRNCPTLDAFLMRNPATYSNVQVHKTGIRAILEDGSEKSWTRQDCPISCCCSTESQVMAAFDDNLVVLFETKERALPIELSSHSYPMEKGKITSIAMQPPGKGVIHSKWAVVATDASLVYVANIEIGQNCWEVTSQKAVDSPASDLAFLVVPGVGSILHIGHENGVLTRIILDDANGSLGIPQICLLGNAPVHFSFAEGSLICNSSSPWVANGTSIKRLSSEPFASVARINAEFCQDGGFVGITNKDLVIFEIGDSSSMISSESYGLELSPRQVVPIPETSLICVMNSESHKSIWRSSIKVFDSSLRQFIGSFEFDSNACVVASCFIPSQKLLAIGCAIDLTFMPKKCSGGQILLFDIQQNPPILVQKTDVEDIPQALGIFGEFILAGVGNTIRIYEIGKTQLLKKSETHALPYSINFVQGIGSRIIVGDSSESFHFLKYDKIAKVITPFADDCTPRFPISSLALDRSTVACGDRFGNFTILRLPPDVSDEAEIDPSGVGMVWEHPDFCGAPNKLEIAANYHVGTTITSLALSPSGGCLIYGTVNGEIGVLIPLESDADIRVCRKLEAEMRDLIQSPCGRRHDLFRSYYAPVKGVSDGDLLDRYLELGEGEKKKIAEKIKCEPYDIVRILSHYESML